MLQPSGDFIRPYHTVYVYLTTKFTNLLSQIKHFCVKVSKRFICSSYKGKRQRTNGNKHRRNNHGDRGRQVPPTFGWGTSNVLVSSTLEKVCSIQLDQKPLWHLKSSNKQTNHYLHSIMQLTLSISSYTYISKSFFQDICDPSSCIRHLLPPPRDTSDVFKYHKVELCKCTCKIIKQ